MIYFLFRVGWNRDDQAFFHTKIIVQNKIQTIDSHADDHTPHHAGHHSTHHTTQAHSIADTKRLNKQCAADGHAQ